MPPSTNNMVLDVPSAALILSIWGPFLIPGYELMKSGGTDAPGRRIANGEFLFPFGYDLLSIDAGDGSTFVTKSW